MSTFLKYPVRILFGLTSKHKAFQNTRAFSSEYMDLATQLGSKAGISKKVPKMIGVDEDMREWSFFQLLEHHVIVNRSITNLICALVADVPESELPTIDIKHDVMPGPDAGVEQVEAFHQSVEDHLQRVSALSDLRNTGTFDHPMFGSFTAHQWTCLFAFHLKIHLRQARFLSEGK